MDFENNQAPQQPYAPVQPQQAPYQAPVAPQQAPYQAPYQAPVAPQQAPALPQANKGKSKLPLLIGVVAVVALVAVVISLIGGSGYKKALENYLEYEYKNDTSNIESLIPDSVWEDYADEEDMDKDEVIDLAIENVEDWAEFVEENEWTYEYEIGDYEKIDDGDLDDIKDGLEDMYDIDPDSVGNKGYVAEVEVTLFVDGEEDDSHDFDAYMVKIDGDWYVVDEDGYFMF